MGQPVTVIEKASPYPDVVRFETNRALTGMGHESYRSLDDVKANRPPELIARALFEHGGVAAVHVNANVITVHLSRSDGAAGLKQVIEDIYIYYREGVEVPSLEAPAPAAE